MRFQQVWRRLLSQLLGGPRPNSLVRQRTCRLRVEALEDRLVPTTWFVATPSTADNFHPQNPGNNANNGMTPATPFGDIQQAVNVAQTGDRIFVAKGAYGYNAALNQLSAPLGINPAVVMLMDKSVEIYGGFNNNFSVCDPVLYHTVIDGGFAVRGVYVLSNTTAINFLMSGFTIEQGFAQAETHLNPATAGNDAIDGIGGGMWINDAARHGAGSFILQDMVFYKNQATGTSLATVGGNSGGGLGGGLAVRSVGNLALHRVTFSDNTAQSGSGGRSLLVPPAAGPSRSIIRRCKGVGRSRATT